MKAWTLRLRWWAIAFGLLAATETARPAAPARPSGSPPFFTKWFPGESKPDLTSPTARPSKAERLAPSAGAFSLPSLGAPAPDSGPLTLSPSPAAAAPTSESVAAVAPTISVRSRLDPDQRRFHLGESVQLYVDLSWVGGAGDVVAEAPEEPTLLNLSKKGMVQSWHMAPQPGGARVVMTYHYELLPGAEGAAAIEPLEIRYRLRGGGEVLHLTTDRYGLTILPRRWPWNRMVWGGLGTVGVLGGITAGGMALAARARRRREAANVPPPPSLLDGLRADLDQVRRRLAEGAARDAYDGIEKFVRKALGQCLGEDLRHATISELSERLGNEDLEAAVRDRATAVLDRCAQVKFAGYVPTVADQDQIVADCRLLLDDMENEAMRL